MRLILLGAPGAGKGTQAENISKWYGIPAVSTGNIIRAAIKESTKAGLEAKRFVDSGDLVPDEIVVEMLKERIAREDCKNGFILDGFPRNVTQAQTLDNMRVDIDLVLEIEVSDAEIEERMSGRRVCEGCGASYHVQYNPSAKGEMCEACGGGLIRREDDNPQTVRERLRVYHTQTEPLKEYYQAAGKLKTVRGQNKVEDTTGLVRETLEAVAR